MKEEEGLSNWGDSHGWDMRCISELVSVGLEGDEGP